MSRRPLVSILTPSFNQAAWLRENLRSVSQQTYENIEHVVMDGGSTDDSIEILRHVDARVRWRSQKDRGQSHALNLALSASRGEIVGWLNSDDAYFDHGVVEHVVHAFETQPDVDVVYGHAALVNGDGLILQMIWVPPFSYAILRFYNFITQPAAFIRRSAIGTALADEAFDYTMDRELWLRLGRSSHFSRLDKVLAIDRHHPARKSYTRLDLAESDTMRLVQTYGVPEGRVHHAVRKMLKIFFRLIGVGLVAVAIRKDRDFGGHVDTARALAFRQLVVRRAAMPIGKTRVSATRSDT